MDNLYGNNLRIGKILAVHGGVPVITGMGSHPSTERGCYKPLASTPTVDPYSSRYNNRIKLLQLNSPSSVLDNFGSKSQLKLMEEETFVIDGIPVESSCGTSLIYRDSRRLVPWALEDSISSFPGSKSHLLREKGEQNPSRFSFKNNSPKAFVMAVPELEEPKIAAPPPSRPTQTQKPLAKEIPTQDWSPLDDGIQVSLPSQPGETPCREDVHRHIHHFLYSTKAGRRFPVFTEITVPYKPVAKKTPL
ncbi:hypothetical protein SAY87_018823 [Trapa incisa]|uniref:Uncharacterized protein n=1 Tax=Trapa incisa TaxID=236973 RepID=A0AAN7K3I8_9MYRT|nr:hypothetical protein SAY87_018823 [Trapa incisa]